ELVVSPPTLRSSLLMLGGSTCLRVLTRVRSTRRPSGSTGSSGLRHPDGMKVIGLLGGMSWESSIEYYRLVNERVKAVLGGFHSAHTVLYSVDFAEIERMQVEGRWEDAGAELNRAAKALEAAGADVVVLCTN